MVDVVYGYPIAGADDIPTTRCLAGEVWETIGGDIDSIEVNMSDPGISASFGIYDVDGSDDVDNLIASTPFDTVATAGFGWVEQFFASTVTLPAGRYRFAFVGVGTSNQAYDTGGAANAVQGTGNNTNTFPDPFGGVSIQTTFRMSMRGTVDEGGGGPDAGTGLLKNKMLSNKLLKVGMLN